MKSPLGFADALAGLPLMEFLILTWSPCWRGLTELGADASLSNQAPSPRQLPATRLNSPYPQAGTEDAQPCPWQGGKVRLLWAFYFLSSVNWHGLGCILLGSFERTLGLRIPQKWKLFYWKEKVQIFVRWWETLSIIAYALSTACVW